MTTLPLEGERQLGQARAEAKARQVDAGKNNGRGQIASGHLAGSYKQSEFTREARDEIAVVHWMWQACKPSPLWISLCAIPSINALGVYLGVYPKHARHKPHSR